MGNLEQRGKLKTLLWPEDVSDFLVNALLEMAGEIIFNKLYPFGNHPNQTIPRKYCNLQIRIAVEVYSKRGAEGQISHNENGISRAYEASGISPSLLKEIVPCVGVVSES